jgi:hypothetical protein
MIAWLRHGCALGAALGALTLAAEIVIGRAPALEIAEAAGWTPAYVAAGAVLGLLAALAGLAAPPRARERAPGILLFATVLALGTVALAWLPSWLAGAGAVTPRALLVFGCAVGVHLLGVAAATSRRAWMFAAFTAPLTAAVLLLLLCGTALLLRETLPYERAPTAPIRSAAPATAGPPNLLIVVLEGVRADRLGCYGSFRATTPYLDALAQEAVLFEQAFAVSSEHGDALAGLLGGPSLAAGLAARGYRTWAGSGGDATAAGAALAGFGAREDARRPRLAERLRLARLLAAAHGEGLEPTGGGDAELIERALAWLRASESERPFGIVLHLGETGPPHDPPRELRERFRPEDLDASRLEEIRRGQQPEWHRRAESGERDAGDEEVRALTALQDAELLAADARIAGLLESLRTADLLERTLVIVTSDHGARFGEERGRLGHAGSAHDAVLRVPLLMRLPQWLPAATRARGLVSLADLAPGALAALDGRRDGVLARAAAGETPREAILATLRIGGAPHRVLRAEREKFLLDASGRLVAAGDLRADPDETFLRRPVVGTDRVKRALRERADALLAELEQAPTRD